MDRSRRRIGSQWKRRVLAGGLGMLLSAQAPAVSPLVPEAERIVAPVLKEKRAEAQAEALEYLARARVEPARGKVPAVVDALVEPWTGFRNLEHEGWVWARDTAPLPGWLRTHLGSMNALRSGVKSVAEGPVFPAFSESGKDDPLAYLVAVVESAEASRQAAVAAFSEEEQAFIAGHARDIVRLFNVQLFSADSDWLSRYGVAFHAYGLFDGIQRVLVERDIRVVESVAEKMDWTAMLAAAATLSRLGDPDWQDALLALLEGADPLPEQTPGVTGDVLWRHESEAGWILIGGRNSNRYQFPVSPAAIIDLGGDSVWEGVVAASDYRGTGNAVVVSLGGDDRFYSGNLGLASGVLGVGMIINRSGNDHYYAADGGAAVGIAGIGVILEAGGEDLYRAGRFSLGAGFAGLGLLLAEAGDMRHEGDMLTLGFGGPGGLGLVLRRDGNSEYVAGRTTPSGYNPLSRFPDHPRFEYSGFSMGSGSGRRVFSPHAAEKEYALAGGVGVFIGGAGADRYEAGNFSLGSGYFFGAGVFLERGGDDHYMAGRYGMAAGAHYGVSLFIDYAGDDVYASRGPTYNGGCAWDFSVSLFLEGGGDDRYLLASSGGLGRADHQSWAVAVDFSGHDVYQVPSGLGAATNRSMAAFFDLGGEDDYSQALPRHDPRPGNEAVHLRDRALFWDGTVWRPDPPGGPSAGSTSGQEAPGRISGR